jgi:hypothetical protein
MEIEDAQRDQGTQDDAMVLGSSSIHVGDVDQAIFQKENETSTTRLSSRTVRLDVPFPKFLPGGNGSRDKLGRENYVNFYNGVKYLLAKYGSGPFVKKLVRGLISTMQSPKDVLVRDQYGRLTLSDSVPKEYRAKPFTADDLHALENLIIESNSFRANKGKGMDMVDTQGRLRPYVPRPVLVGGKDIFLDEIFPGEMFPGDGIRFFPEEARENYRNYHTAMDYYVKTYGSRQVNEALAEFRASSRFPRLELDPIPDKNGQERLIPIPQDNAPMLARNFDNNRFQEVESLIIEHSKREGNQALQVVEKEGNQAPQVVEKEGNQAPQVVEKEGNQALQVVEKEGNQAQQVVEKEGNQALQVVKTSAQVVKVATKTGKTAVALAKAVTAVEPDRLDVINKSLSLAKNVMAGSKLGLEIQNNPASKGKRRILKTTETVTQTAREAISLFQAVTAVEPDILDGAAKASSFASSVISCCQLGLEALDKAATDETISPPVILRREEKVVCYVDEENIARENFEDFYNAVKYLVKKYGLLSIPVDTLKELNSLCGGNAPLVPDDQDQLQLSDLIPNGRREKPFTMKQLTHLENRITGQEGRENLKLALRTGEAIAATAEAIASCGAGFTFFGAVSLLKTAYDAIQVFADLAQD